MSFKKNQQRVFLNFVDFMDTFGLQEKLHNADLVSDLHAIRRWLDFINLFQR